jgi:hypothetical protein
MTNTVLLKRSSTPSSAPAAASLSYGELAINYTDGNLFYKNASNVVTVIASNQFSSVTGNITGGNISTGGQLTAAGNITGGNLITPGNVYIGAGNAGYVYGNAYFMTGISAGISVTKIENGNSNVWVNTAGGDVTVSAGGVSNVAVFSTGSLTLSGAFGSPKAITKNVVIAGGINAMLVGPLIFADGVSLTVPDSSTVYVYTPG